MHSDLTNELSGSSGAGHVLINGLLLKLPQPVCHISKHPLLEGFDKHEFGACKTLYFCILHCALATAAHARHPSIWWSLCLPAITVPWIQQSDGLCQSLSDQQPPLPQVTNIDFMRSILQGFKLLTGCFLPDCQVPFTGVQSLSSV